MNWEQIEGRWKQYSGRFREKWGKLTDSDLEVIHGRRDQLVGKIQEHYGISREEAERQVTEYLANLRETPAEQRAEKARGAGRS
jgi:uncharacterized protein YjbJ (UPF0337 family)